MSLIAGMKDRKLAEKAIAEEYTLKQVIQGGVNRETSKANLEAMQARPQATSTGWRRGYIKGETWMRGSTISRRSWRML